MHIYIVRHGESLATRDPGMFERMNPKDIPLTRWGYEQMLEAGEHIARLRTNQKLADRPLRIYHGPHLRIVQSKDAFLTGLRNHPHHAVVSTEESMLLKEREHGRFDGLSPFRQHSLQPEIYEQLHGNNPFTGYITPMPDGESVQDLHERMRMFLGQLRRDAKPDEDIVIITHGGNCRLLEDLLTHYTTVYSDFHAPPIASISEIQTDLKLAGKASRIFEGKERPKHLADDHKAQPHMHRTGSTRGLHNQHESGGMEF